MLEHVVEARKKLYERMESESVALFFAGSAPHRTTDQYYKYAPQRNFYYLTNLHEPNMILMMLNGKEDTKTYLFVEENTDHIIKWEGARMEKQAASERSGIDIANIRYLKEFDGMFHQVMNYARSVMGTPPKTLYLDLYHVDPKNPPIALEQADRILKNYKELTVKAINEHTSYLRMFKSDAEIKQIQAAINHTEKGLNNVMKKLKARSHEYQLEADFLHEITLSGSEGNAFETIAACSDNATVLHYIENRDVLKKDALILFDLGALHQNYASDISRTYPVSGKFTKRQKTLYNIVLEVNKATIEEIRPGVTWKHLNDFAKQMLIEKTKAIGLIKEDTEISELYYHSIGHFMGLDVHDVGHYNIPLEAGMVLTIEPGLYIKDEGIGIRIEDDILVTKDGYKNLSQSIIKEVEDIEAFIALDEK